VRLRARRRGAPPPPRPRRAHTTLRAARRCGAGSRGAAAQVFGTVPLGRGSFTGAVRVPLHQLARKPRALSFAEAAALPLVGVTALQALFERNSLAPGEHLLLIGASGGVGHVALQAAAPRPAARALSALSDPREPRGAARAAVRVPASDDVA